MAEKDCVAKPNNCRGLSVGFICPTFAAPCRCSFPAELNKRHKHNSLRRHIAAVPTRIRHRYAGCFAIPVRKAS